MKPDCPFGFLGVHESRVIGTVRSAMTWHFCELCGYKEPRGPGWLYQPAERPNESAADKQEGQS